VDRFHVARLYRNDLDGLRKKEMRRLRDELSEKEYFPAGRDVSPVRQKCPILQSGKGGNGMCVFIRFWCPIQVMPL
ncbi:MAG: hypothetical protein DRI57_27925, partial [Deltaproteobacteria bacterium]